MGEKEQEPFGMCDALLDGGGGVSRKAFAQGCRITYFLGTKRRRRRRRPTQRQTRNNNNDSGKKEARTSPAHLGVVPRRRHLHELLGLLRRGGLLLAVVSLALLAVRVVVAAVLVVAVGVLVVVVVPVTVGGVLLVFVVVVPVRVIVRAPLVAAVAMIVLLLAIGFSRFLGLLAGLFLLRLLESGFMCRFQC